MTKKRSKEEIEAAKLAREAEKAMRAAARYAAAVAREKKAEELRLKRERLATFLLVNAQRKADREGARLAEVIAYLVSDEGRALWPWFCRTNAGRAGGLRLAPPGTPDILAYDANGRFWGIEVKGRVGKLRPDQEAWRDLARGHGVGFVLARCADDLRAVTHACP